jgi:cell division protein FtsQ
MEARLRRISLPAMPEWPRLRRRLIVGAVLAVVLAAGYMLWLRNSSLVAVTDVAVEGAESYPAAEAALAGAADEMTTLNVDRDALAAAVADNPAIVSIDTSTDFPHGLTIEVEARRAAGYVEEGGAIVAGDGVILESGAERPDGLPLIEVDGEAGSGTLSGETLAVAEVLGPAPEALAGEIDVATFDADHGPVVTLSPGIDLRFGDASQAAMKWRAAATVLADPALDSASYIDLSAASRPVVG